jgi:hypothetical protein
MFGHLDDVVFLSAAINHNIPALRRTAYPFGKVVQYLDLNQGLVVESILDSHRSAGEMARTMQDLTKGTRTNGVDMLSDRD